VDKFENHILNKKKYIYISIMDSVIVIKSNLLTLNDILNNEKLMECLFIDIDAVIELGGDEDLKDSDYYKTELKVVDTNNTYTIIYGYPGDNPVGCILLENNDVIGIGNCFEGDCLIPDIDVINAWYWKFVVEFEDIEKNEDEEENIEEDIEKNEDEEENIEEDVEEDIEENVEENKDIKETNI